MNSAHQLEASKSKTKVLVEPVPREGTRRESSLGEGALPPPLPLRTPGQCGSCRVNLITSNATTPESEWW